MLIHFADANSKETVCGMFIGVPGHSHRYITNIDQLHHVNCPDCSTNLKKDGFMFIEKFENFEDLFIVFGLKKTASEYLRVYTHPCFALYQDFLACLGIEKGKDATIGQILSTCFFMELSSNETAKILDAYFLHNAKPEAGIFEAEAVVEFYFEHLKQNVK